jgi:hypothetical protein
MYFAGKLLSPAEVEVCNCHTSSSPCAVQGLIGHERAALFQSIVHKGNTRFECNESGWALAAIVQ